MQNNGEYNNHEGNNDKDINDEDLSFPGELVYKCDDGFITISCRKQGSTIANIDDIKKEFENLYTYCAKWRNDQEVELTTKYNNLKTVLTLPIKIIAYKQDFITNNIKTTNNSIESNLKQINKIIDEFKALTQQKISNISLQLDINKTTKRVKFVLKNKDKITNLYKKQPQSVIPLISRDIKLTIPTDVKTYIKELQSKHKNANITGIINEKLKWKFLIQKNTNINLDFDSQTLPTINVKKWKGQQLTDFTDEKKRNLLLEDFYCPKDIFIIQQCEILPKELQQLTNDSPTEYTLTKNDIDNMFNIVSDKIDIEIPEITEKEKEEEKGEGENPKDKEKEDPNKEGGKGEGGNPKDKEKEDPNKEEEEKNSKDKEKRRKKEKREKQKNKEKEETKKEKEKKNTKDKEKGGKKEKGEKDSKEKEDPNKEEEKNSKEKGKDKEKEEGKKEGSLLKGRKKLIGYSLDDIIINPTHEHFYFLHDVLAYIDDWKQMPKKPRITTTDHFKFEAPQSIDNKKFDWADPIYNNYISMTRKTHDKVTKTIFDELNSLRNKTPSQAYTGLNNLYNQIYNLTGKALDNLTDTFVQYKPILGDDGVLALQRYFLTQDLELYNKFGPNSKNFDREAYLEGIKMTYIKFLNLKKYLDNCNKFYNKENINKNAKRAIKQLLKPIVNEYKQNENDIYHNVTIPESRKAIFDMLPYIDNENELAGKKLSQCLKQFRENCISEKPFQDLFGRKLYNFTFIPQQQVGPNITDIETPTQEQIQETINAHIINDLDYRDLKKVNKDGIVYYYATNNCISEKPLYCLNTNNKNKDNNNNKNKDNNKKKLIDINKFYCKNTDKKPNKCYQSLLQCLTDKIIDNFTDKKILNQAKSIKQCLSTDKYNMPLDCVHIVKRIFVGYEEYENETTPPYTKKLFDKDRNKFYTIDLRDFNGKDNFGHIKMQSHNTDPNTKKLDSEKTISLTKELFTKLNVFTTTGIFIPNDKINADDKNKGYNLKFEEEQKAKKEIKKKQLEQLKDKAFQALGYAIEGAKRDKEDLLTRLKDIRTGVVNAYGGHIATKGVDRNLSPINRMIADNQNRIEQKGKRQFNSNRYADQIGQCFNYNYRQSNNNQRTSNILVQAGRNIIGTNGIYYRDNGRGGWQ